MKKNNNRIYFIFFLLFLQVSCHSTPTIKHTLYLGQNINHQSQRFEKKFDQFIKTTVAPLFPSFTILNGYGQWDGEEEPVKVMVIIYRKSSENRAKIAMIKKQYLIDFEQDVLLESIETVQANLCRYQKHQLICD